jgi:hypothetical protein
LEIDDHVVPARRGRGRRPRLSDAELLTLAAAQVLLGIEARWIRFAYCRLGHLFRYLPKQPGYHKRLVAAAPLLAVAITHLEKVSPSWCDDLRLLDATPLPCGTSRETAKRSDLAGHAGYGYCAEHSRFYWGFKLYLLASPDGMPIAWCLAKPKTGEREVCLDLRTSRWRPDGFLRGPRCWPTRAWPDARSKARSPRSGSPCCDPTGPTNAPATSTSAACASGSSPCSTRSRISSVSNATPDQPAKASAPASLNPLFALAAAIWHNWATNAPVKRNLTAYDH